MDPLGPFSAQAGVMTLLKTGAANLFAARRQSAQQALLEQLEKSSPEKAAGVKKQYQESHDLLQRIDSSRNGLAEQRKADATEKIRRIKEELATRRLLAAVDPAAAARHAAQLTNALKQAVRQYGSADGGAAANLPPSAIPAALDADAAAESAAQAGEGAETPAGAQNNSPPSRETVRQSLEEIKRQRETPGNVLRNKIHEEGSAAAAATATLRADFEFARAAKDARDGIKRILEAAERKLEEKGGADNPDIAAGGRALSEVTTAINDISPAATPVASSVNIFA